MPLDAFDCSHATFPTLLHNVSGELPNFMVGDECSVAGLFSRMCSMHWDHIELTPDHPSVQCLQQSTKQLSFVGHVNEKDPVRGVWLCGDEECPNVLELMTTCSDGRLFWLMEFDSLEKSRVKLLPKDVLTYRLVCVPRDCDLDTVGLWLAPVIHTMVEGSDHLKFDWPSLFINPCHPGMVRMPFRKSFKISYIKELVRIIGQEQAEHVFALSHNAGFRFLRIEEQRLQRQLAQTHSVDTSKSSLGTAVLFSGDWRFSVPIARRIRGHLIEPLAAGVFVVISNSSEVDAHREHVEHVKGDGAKRVILQAFGDHLLGFRCVRDLSTKQLEKAFRDSGSLDLYEALGSVNFTEASWLHSLRKLQLVWKLVEVYESRKGRRFYWIVYSRLDLVWMANHPPLELLDRSVIWIPFTHFRNLFANDNHAAIPRNLAKAYIKRWDLFVNGTAPVMPDQGAEQYLRNVLQINGVGIGRWPDVASLGNCHHWSCFWKPQLLRGKRNLLRWAQEEAEIAEYAPQIKAGRYVWFKQDMLLPVDSRWGPVKHVRYFRLSLKQTW